MRKRAQCGDLLNRGSRIMTLQQLAYINTLGYMLTFIVLGMYFDNEERGYRSEGGRGVLQHARPRFAVHEA